MLNPWIVFYQLGIYPVLVLSSEEVRALAPGDVALLRELGVDDALLEELRTLAQVPGRALRVDVVGPPRVTIET